MKNKLIIGAVALMSLAALTGCNQKDKPSSSTSESSTSETQASVESVTVTPARSNVYLNDESTTIQLTATVLPATAVNKNVSWKSSDSTIASVDKNGLVTGKKLGKVTITVTTEDGNFTAEASVSVKQDRSQEDTITSLIKPTFLNKYELHTAELEPVAGIATRSNPNRSSFYQNEQGTKDVYKVGNQNEFKVSVTANAIDEDLEEEVIANPFTTTKFELFDGTKYNAISEGDLAQHVSITNKGYKFTEASSGKRYKVTISVDETKYASVSEYCDDIVFEVEVFDGYNVYTKQELTVYDNFQTAWNDIKAENGLTDVVAKGIALHADLEITNDDLPAAFKYSASDVATYKASYPDDFSKWVAKKGANRPTQEERDAFDAAAGTALLTDSVKDWTTVFNRRTATTDEFKFEGNYFTIDASKIKQIHAFGGNPLGNGTVNTEYQPDSETEGSNGSHGQFFGINTEQDSGGGNYYFNNMTVIGNGNRSSDDNYLGGLITLKTKSVTLRNRNILTSRTFITFLTEKQDRERPAAELETKTYFDRVKNFDSYNSLLYIWGTGVNVLTNSYMVGAGGALALLDDINAHKADDYHGTPVVDAYNCYLSNPVKGTEPWFVNHKATSLVQLMQGFGMEQAWLGRNAKAHGTHMNILGTDGTDAYLDLLAIVIDGSAPLGNYYSKGGSPLKGSFNIYNDAALTTKSFALDMSRMGAAGIPIDADFGTNVYMQYAQGNVLPLYRAMAASQSSPGIVVETSAGGHAMLGDTTYTNGVVGYFDGTNPSPMPFYNLPPYIPDGDGTVEVAYNQLAFKSNMDNLASGDYMSVYLQPVLPGETDLSLEYLGAFVRLHEMGA